MGTPDLTEIRARVRGTGGKTVLAQPRGACRYAGVPGVPPPRVSGERDRVARSGRPPIVPQADERVAGAGRRQRRLHGAARRADRSLRPPARRGDPRPAAVFRDGDDARRRRHGPARRKSRRPSDQGRRQPRSSRQPRRDRSLRAGVGPDALRSRSLAVDSAARRDPAVERVHHRDARRPVGAGGDQGRRPADPHRNGRLADAGRAAAAGARRAIPARSGFSGSRCRRPTTRAPALALALGQYRRSRSTTSPRPTSSSRSTPTSCRPKARRTCATRGSSRRAVGSTPSPIG